MSDNDSGIQTDPSLMTTSNRPKAPELGFIYSLILTPIAGAVFWSRNWKRLGKPEYRWWTWVSAIVVFGWYFLSLSIWDNIWPGLITTVAWQLIIFSLQKRITPPDIRSTSAWVWTGILFAATLAIGIYSMRPESQGGIGSSLQIGTSYNKNSPTLSVSGTNYRTDTTLYARIYSSASFETSSINVLLEKKNGAGWNQVFNSPVGVAPNYDVLVDPFYVTQTGTYHMEVLNNSQIIAQITFAVK